MNPLSPVRFAGVYKLNHQGFEERVIIPKKARVDDWDTSFTMKTVSTGEQAAEIAFPGLEKELFTYNNQLYVAVDEKEDPAATAYLIIKNSINRIISPRGGMKEQITQGFLQEATAPGKLKGIVTVKAPEVSIQPLQ